MVQSSGMFHHLRLGKSQHSWYLIHITNSINFLAEPILPVKWWQLPWWTWWSETVLEFAGSMFLRLCAGLNSAHHIVLQPHYCCRRGIQLHISHSQFFCFSCKWCKHMQTTINNIYHWKNRCQNWVGHSESWDGVPAVPKVLGGALLICAVRSPSLKILLVRIWMLKSARFLHHGRLLPLIFTFAS